MNVFFLSTPLQKLVTEMRLFCFPACDLYKTSPRLFRTFVTFEFAARLHFTALQFDLILNGLATSRFLHYYAVLFFTRKPPEQEN